MAERGASRESGVQVIARAAAILRALSPEGSSLGELARLTGLPRSTVQRIVDALAAESLVETGPGGVRPGWGLQSLAQLARSDVAARARPYLEVLFSETHETVEFSVVHGREAACLERIVCDQEVRVVPAAVRPQLLDRTAAGRAILACMEDPVVCALIAGPGTRTRSRPHAPLAALLAELAGVRQCGFSYDRQEHSPGVCSIGTSIDVLGLRAHAVSVAVPSARFEAGLPQLRRALAACREQLTAALSCG